MDDDVYVISRDGGQTKITGIKGMMYNFAGGGGLWVLFERSVREGIVTESSQLLPNDYYSCVFVSMVIKSINGFTRSWI